MTSERRRNIVVGLFVMVAAGVLLAITLLIRGGVDVRRTTLFAAYDEVGGLEVGSAVMVSGVRAGRVVSIEGRPEKPNIVVKFQVGKALPVYADARAVIAQQGFIGDKRLDVRPGTEAAGPVRDGAFIEGVPAPSLEAAIGQVNDIVKDLAVTTRAVSELVSSEQNRAAVEKSLADLGRSMEVVARLLEENEENIGAILANTREATAELPGMQRKATALLDSATARVDSLGGESEALVAELREAVGDLRARSATLISSLDERQAALGESANRLAATVDTEFARTAQSLARTSDALERILAKVDRGDGTVGLLVNDPSLFRSVNESVQALRNALIGPNRRLFDTRLDYAPAAPEPGAAPLP
ncbi:MAG: MlaD family protein [Candidatus Sumerlaeia bacterium]|nr:MlaD family protein [Candidatus Sumerlaeia bacterium]